jgi:hypothetical protein
VAIRWTIPPFRYRLAVVNGFSMVVATLLAVDFTTADFFAFLVFAQRAFAAAATSNGHGEIQGSFTAFRMTTSKTGLAASKSGVQDDDV